VAQSECAIPIASKDVRTGASLSLQTAERLGPALKGSGVDHVRISQWVKRLAGECRRLIDEGALCGDPPDDILRCQYRRHRHHLA
jgi:hypothetical protein